MSVCSRSLVLLLAVISSMQLPSASLAQSTASVLCANTSTGNIRAVRRCSGSETQLTTRNFAAIIGANSGAATPTPGPQSTPTARPSSASSINLSTCYKTSGQNRGTPQNGELSVAVQCNRPTQVLLSFEFGSNDTSQAQPTLLNQTLLFNGSVPNGVQVTTKGGGNKFYTLTVSGVCCERS
jgi:hypothetical protein